jgi:uncharacterized protein (TIGR03382 family)
MEPRTAAIAGAAALGLLVAGGLLLRRRRGV